MEGDIPEIPTSKLFKSIPPEAYAQAFKLLEHVRAQHPHYRDDDLLMFILSRIFSIGHWVIPKEVLD